jgi:tyrosinase
MATKAKRSTKKAKAPAAPASVYRQSNIHQGSRKISVKELPESYSRCDIEFIGVDHSGASYEARVYLNNPKADINTEPTEANGYAGAYHIFGHGGCFGDLGHCDIYGTRDIFDPRPSHPLEPIRKVIIATDAVKRAAAQGKDITVTVVPVVMAWNEKAPAENVLKFDHINVVTYD